MTIAMKASMKNEEALRWHLRDWKGFTFWVRDWHRLGKGVYHVAAVRGTVRFIADRPRAGDAVLEVCRQVETHLRQLDA